MNAINMCFAEVWVLDGDVQVVVDVAEDVVDLGVIIAVASGLPYRRCSGYGDPCVERLRACRQQVCVEAMCLCRCTWFVYRQLFGGV